MGTVRSELLLVMLLIASPAWSNAATGEHGEEHASEEEHDENILRRSAEQLREFGITLQVAGPGKLDTGIELLGEVQPNGDTLAHIVPRFPGIALTVRKSVGDVVKSGEVLATIQSNESLAPYELKTLTDGTVIEKHITRGEAVERDTPSFVIADLSSVWIDLNVYQKDIHEVAVGQAVRVSCHGLPDMDGTLSYLAPVVDRPTRTADARVVLPNPDHLWRPGLFVSARVLGQTEVAIAVPRTALQTMEDRSVVFIESPEGLVPRPVLVGRSGESYVEILSGLTAGDRYVSTNSFLLKAELGKGGAEHDH